MGEHITFIYHAKYGWGVSGRMHLSNKHSLARMKLDLGSDLVYGVVIRILSRTPGDPPATRSVIKLAQYRRTILIDTLNNSVTYDGKHVH